MTPIRPGPALVTGAARRLGREIALALADRGHDVIVHCHRSLDDAAATAESVQQKGVRAHILPMDLRDPGNAEKFIRQAVDPFGPLQVLINNASVFPARTLAEESLTTLQETLHINALTPLFLTRAFAATAAPGGCVINILDQRVGANDLAHAGYQFSKDLLLSMTRLSAVNYAPDIRVNGIAPGLILAPANTPGNYLKSRAPRTLLQKKGNPGDVIRALNFLLDSPFVTGEVIRIDGGERLKGMSHHD